MAALQQSGSASSPHGLARLTRLTAMSFLCWVGIWLLQNAAMAADTIRRDRELDIVHQLLTSATLYIPWALFCPILWIILTRAGERISQLKFALVIYLGGALLFFVPYNFYQITLDHWLTGVPWSTFPDRLKRWAAITVFIDFILYSACIALIFALVIFNRSLDERRRKQAVEAENLTLRLEVEQHRLATLQAQLEPHFLFNALNAISALVRGDDKGAALEAIVRLSDLLRYALTASKKDWATLDCEINFLSDYLSLQAVRHGSRLSVKFTMDDTDTGSIDIPPLLLQPLVENAIRHGLDGNEAPCDLNIVVNSLEDRLMIAIDNPNIADATPNPGTGFGLAAVRERLSLIYGVTASMSAAQLDGRFVVTLDLPRDILD